FWATRPALPMPVTTRWPLQERTASTAESNSGPRRSASDCTAAASILRISRPLSRFMKQPIIAGLTPPGKAPIIGAPRHAQTKRRILAAVLEAQLSRPRQVHDLEVGLQTPRRPADLVVEHLPAGDRGPRRGGLLRLLRPRGPDPPAQRHLHL